MKTKQLTILVADDDMDYLFQTKIMLEQLGHKVITADSQREAEEILLSVHPDLAIFDLMMESDDSGFILSYKAKRIYPEMPVIIATAVASETGIAFGLNSDAEKSWIKADMYLEKGIRREQLQKAIAQLIVQ